MSDNTVYLITGANRGKHHHLVASHPTSLLHFSHPPDSFPAQSNPPHHHLLNSTLVNPLLIHPLSHIFSLTTNTPHFTATGIGLALTTLLLTRPHTTVIATSRALAPSLTPASSSFLGGGDGAIHPTSRLLPVLLDEAQPALTSATLAARLRAEHGIDRLDVVIANAGGSSAVKWLLETDPETEMAWDFDVNALGPARLFRGVWGLLEREDGLGKFVLMSSSVGSIAALEGESLPGVGYGMSK